MGKKKKHEVVLPNEEELYIPHTKKLPYKVKLKCKNKKQKEYAKLIDNEKIEMVFVKGKAGCGKTYVAVCKALELLKEREEYEKIYLVTSAVQSEEEIGMLPGNVSEKLYPSMMSFRIVIEELIGKSECDKLFEQGYIEYMPISYLRGVNLRNCIVLGDELQNLTIRGMKTLLTRISYNAKFIIMGDTEQIDRPKLKKETSGLHYIIEKLKENPDERMGIVEFGEEDVVRNPIINTILNLFGES
jgi:phosphate starvation-inducible PhoH-like protein